MIGTLEHSDGSQCIRHRRYKLSCHQYNELLGRSENICEICDRPLARAHRGLLAIDHDPRYGQWAVRGMLCNGCNAKLGDDNDNFRTAKEYLANAWWEQECARFDLPLTQRAEPPLGSAIRNQFRVVWVHLTPGIWHARTQAGHSWGVMSWGYMFEQYGPHNLVDYDLPGAYLDGSIPDDLLFTIETRREWAPIREQLETITPIAERFDSDRPSWLSTPEDIAKALNAYLTPGKRVRVAELLMQSGVP